MRFKTFLIPLVVFFCLQVPSAHAQLPGFLEQPAAAETENKEPKVDIRDQLKTWKEQIDSDLATLARYESEELPPGVSKTEFNARRRYLEETQLAISRHAQVFEEIAKAEASLETSKAAADAWKGFGEDAPISILEIDELVERKVAIEEKLASQRSSIKIFQNTLSGLLKESKEAEASVGAALAAYEQAGENDLSALWKLETERARQRSLFVRASSLQHGITSFEKNLKAGEADLALLSKQIDEAGKGRNAFNEKDLERIEAASANRRAELEKEIEEVRNRLLKSEADRSVAARELAKLEAGEQPDSAALELAALELEAANAGSDSLRSMVECLEALEQIEAFIPEAYEYRLAFREADSAAGRSDALESLRSLDQRLSAWKIVTENELISVASDISGVQSRLATFSSDDPRLVPLNRLRSVFWERRAFVQRANQNILKLHKSLERWISDSSEQVKQPWYAPVASVFKRSWASLARFWNIPVSKYEDTIEIDGQEVVQVRFVSLGAIITAVILFIIAYLIAAGISRRVQRTLVHREIMGDNQARTLRNWAMLLVAFLLALATLAWLSIPLTVFAFLAGALAIGVGFGTQTMIKNFISGIILLFERNVRVGDIIEVDGTLGVVSEINTRSSIVRGFNGIENLIPNSLFLENRVVNWTLNTRHLRRELKLGVAYGTPPQDVIKILNDAADRHGLILKDPEPFAIFSNFGDNSLDFILYFWVELNDKTNGMVVESDIRIMVEKRLGELGIGVPFPQRDIHLGTAKPLQVEIARAKRNEEGRAEPTKPELP